MTLFANTALSASNEQGCHSLQAGQMLAAGEKYKGTASSVILYERNTQTMVFAHNPDQAINPTGLVKLLSALIVLEEGNLDDIVTVKRSTLNSVGVGSVSAGLKAGEELSLRDLLYCVMVSSANDAAAVMAEHVAGSQDAFVQKMNARAATLGCVNTHFTNVHGLKDDRQHSTARDMAIIIDEALKNPQFVQFFGTSSYVVPATNLSDARSLKTTNYMMDENRPYYDSRVTGGKPAAATTSDRSVACVAQTANCEYLVVVISAKAKMSGSAVSRYTNYDEASALLDLGFDKFSVQQVLGTAQPFGLYPVANGANHVVVGPDADVYALLPLDFDFSLLQLQDVRHEAALVAPLKEGTVVGSLEIYYDSVFISKVDILARHDVAVYSADDSMDITGDKPDANPIGSILKWAAVVAILTVVLVLAVLFIKNRKIATTKHKMKEKA